MGLFSAAIRRDSFSLLRFLFLSQVQVFLYEISPKCRLKCPYCGFSFHFCFLIIFVRLMLLLFILFLIAEISLSLFFFYVAFETSYRGINFNAFLDSYSLSASSLVCKALYILISFCSLVHLLCFSSHFKNGLEYFMRGFYPCVYTFDEISAI